MKQNTCRGYFSVDLTQTVEVVMGQVPCRETQHVEY